MWERRRTYIAVVRDGDRVYRYVLDASSRSEALREARQGVASSGAVVLEVNPDVPAGSRSRSRRTRQRAVTAATVAIGLTILIAKMAGVI